MHCVYRRDAMRQMALFTDDEAVHVLSRSLWTTVCQTKTRGPVVALSGLEALRMEAHHLVSCSSFGAADDDLQSLQSLVAALCLAAHLRKDGGRRPHS